MREWRVASREEPEKSARTCQGAGVAAVLRVSEPVGLVALPGCPVGPSWGLPSPGWGAFTPLDTPGGVGAHPLLIHHRISAEPLVKGLKQPVSGMQSCGKRMKMRETQARCPGTALLCGAVGRGGTRLFARERGWRCVRDWR